MLNLVSENDLVCKQNSSLRVRIGSQQGCFVYQKLAEVSIIASLFIGEDDEMMKRVRMIKNE